MILSVGDNLFVVHRRLFEGDHSRFFVGSVEGYEEGIARVRGYSFARSLDGGNYNRKNECHTKLIPIGSGTVIAYVIPTELVIDQMKIDCSSNILTLTDGGAFTMNISEGILDEYTLGLG